MSRQVRVYDKLQFKMGPTDKIGLQLNAAGDVEIKDASGNVIATLASNAFELKSGKLTGALDCNSQVLKDVKNYAATALSGTNLDIEIDIGGTPYYFTVYPTKA